MFPAFLNIQPVDAWTGTVHIKPDGSVDPVTAPVNRTGNLYTLTGNISSSGDGIVIDRGNIILDGAGFSVQGAYSYAGVHLYESNNVTIRNMIIKTFYYGIFVLASSESQITSNMILNCYHGLWMDLGGHNSVIGNNVTNCFSGIYLRISPGNLFRNNRMDDNDYNFGIDGYGFTTLINDIDTSNTVDGRPMYYWVSKHDLIVPLDAGYVGLVNCTRTTVHDLTIHNVGEGVLLAYTRNCTITNNTIVNSWYGILHIYDSNYNRISGNRLIHNEYGIVLYNTSRYNTIDENSIRDNHLGVWLVDSSNNKFYHNSFKHNSHQVDDYARYEPSVPASINTWDDGYPSGGNYWTDYNGTDGNHDGIGDTPYVIDANNSDHYPLLVHNIAVFSIAVSRTTIRQGYAVTINVTVENQGSYAETCNLKVYANATVIKTFTGIALNRSGLAKVSFSWNTTGLTVGRYVIKAYASPVQGETETADNTLTDGAILVVKPDVNGDGKVNILDLIRIATSLGARPGDPQWNPNADVNCDNIINILDLILVANSLGT